MFFLSEAPLVFYGSEFYSKFVFLTSPKNRTDVIRQKFLLIISRKRAVFANENASPANQAENRAKKPANQKRRLF